MKKSRKKMLLSSIAMLLVALVALGSATFAWYYTNDQVTANGTTGRAAASDGLVIRKEVGDNWASSITYTSSGVNKYLTPSAWDYTKTTTSTWNGEYGAKGASVADGTHTQNGTPVPASTFTATGKSFADIADYVTYDYFYVATPKADSQSVTMQIKGSTIANTYINVLVFVDGTLRASATSTPNKSSTTGRDSTFAAAGTLTFTGLNTATTDFTVTSNNNDARGSLIEVIAYPDGENDLCTTNGALTTAFPVTFQFDTYTSSP